MVYGCWIGVHRRTNYKVLSPYRPENQLYISTYLTNGLSGCQPEKQGVWKVILYCEYGPPGPTEAEYWNCSYVYSGCWIWPYTDFAINIIKSGFEAPWRKCQNTQSMLFPSLFREHMGHITIVKTSPYESLFVVINDFFQQNYLIVRNNHIFGIVSP